MAPRATSRLTRSGLRWAGGKTWLADALGPPLLSLIQRTSAPYAENYAGGAALALWLRAHGGLGQQCWIELNEELVHFYGQIQAKPERVIEVAQTWCALPMSPSDIFYGIRAFKPRELAPAVRAARFYVLNRLGFNGLYRVNARGEFNAPFGRLVLPQPLVDAERLLALSKLLSAGPVSIECGRAERILGYLPCFQRRPVIFMDPPYHGTFTAYASTSWSADDHERMARLFDYLADCGAHVLLTNAATPWVRARFSRYRQILLQTRYNIAAQADARGAVSELLVIASDDGQLHGEFDRWG